MSEKKKNLKLNLLKGIACSGVVFAHVPFPGVFGKIVDLAAAFAVPFFLMIAGYYSYGAGLAVIRRRLVKIIKIFAIAYALFFLYDLAGPLATHTEGAWFAEHFSWKTPIYYLCFCTIDFATPLWYLIVMIEVYVLWLIIVKKGKEKAFLKFIPILFALQVLLTTYCETKGLAWSWKINFITRGIPWFLLGYYLHTAEAEGLRKTKSGILWLSAMTGCAIAVIPSVFDLPVKFGIIGYIPYSLSLFVLCLKNPGKSMCRPMEYTGENLSLYIYILHLLVSRALDSVMRRTGIDVKGEIYLWCRPVLVLFATITVSWIVYAVLKKKKQEVTA